MKSLAVAVILILLITDISDAGKRRKAGKRVKGKKAVQLNSSLKGNSTGTDAVNGTTASPPIVGIQRLEIAKLKKKSSLLTKKLKSCQNKVKQAKTCRQRMDKKTKEMDRVVQEGHVMKRKMTSLEEKVAGLKEVIRKEKAEAEILLHEKLSEMKVEYLDRITYLETIVAGLNHSLIFQQENAKRMEKTMRASSKMRITHLRSRYNARISNFEWTIKTLNKTIKKISKEHSFCLNKLNPEIVIIDPAGKFPRTPPMVSNPPKLKPKKRPKNRERLAISRSLTPTMAPTTQTIGPRTSSNYVTTKEKLPTEYDETTVSEDTTIDVTTDLETTDLMMTVDITTDLMTSDDVTTYIMTPDPSISGHGDPQDDQDDVIMKMM